MIAWYLLVIFLTNLFKRTAAEPMRGTMESEMDKRLGLIWNMLRVANMMEHVDRNVLAKVVVMVADTVSTSLVKMDCIADGEWDESGDGSFSMSVDVEDVGVVSSFSSESAFKWYHSTARSINKLLKSCDRKEDAMPSCARLSMVVRRKEDKPPPSTMRRR